MLDPITLAIGVLGIVATPTFGYVGYLTKKVNDNDKLIAAHMAEDEANLTHIKQSLQDLKSGQGRQEDKLDRLIERFL